MAQTRDFLAALMGAAGCKVGLAILRLWMALRRAAGKPVDYPSGWSTVETLSPLLKGRAWYSNTYRDGWRAFALRKLLQAFRQEGCPDTPEIVARGSDALKLLHAMSSQGIVVVGPHTWLVVGVDAILAAEGIKFCNLPDHTGDMRGLLGVREPDAAVPLGPGALVEARRHLRKGLTISVCPDFSSRRQGVLYHDILVSPVIFDFAVNTRARMVFAYSQIGQDGRITVDLDVAGSGEVASDAAILATEFLSFCRRKSPQHADIAMMRPGDLPLLRRQYKNFCIQTREQRRSMKQEQGGDE